MSKFGVADVSHEFLMGVGMTLAVLANQLDVALALQGNRTVRVAALADSAALLVEFAHDAGWGLITADGFEFGRVAPPSLTPCSSRTFVDLLEDDAVKHSVAALRSPDKLSLAEQMIQCLITYDRHAFRQLVSFAPIIEPAAYILIGHTIAALDRMRPVVQQALEAKPKDGDHLLLTYIWLTNILERATLFSTDSGSPWLAGLADSFSWVIWTPSFALTRERTLWGTLIGARAASRFGPSVIDRYLEALERARHPIVALDAIIGLTAIGLRHAAARDPIIKGLERASPGMSERGLFETGAVVHGQLHARQLLTGSTRAGTLQCADTRRDAFDLDEAGQIRAFALMPAAIENPSWRFIPSEAKHRAPPARIARELFTRAWGPSGWPPHGPIWQSAGNA